MDEILELTLFVAETLERLGVPYLVGGSVASSLHATQEVDIVAALCGDFGRRKRNRGFVSGMKERRSRFLFGCTISLVN